MNIFEQENDVIKILEGEVGNGKFFIPQNRTQIPVLSLTDGVTPDLSTDFSESEFSLHPSGEAHR